MKTSPFSLIILTANRLTSIKRLTARITRVALLPEMRSGGGTFAELIWDMDAELRIIGGYLRVLSLFLWTLRSLPL